jgi:hypothetical protein
MWERDYFSADILLNDRDSKYCPSFRQVIKEEKVKCLALPPKSPSLNAFAERWVRSVKEECLSKLILFGGAFTQTGAVSLRNAFITRSEIIRAKITCCSWLRRARR